MHLPQTHTSDAVRRDFMLLKLHQHPKRLEFGVIAQIPHSLVSQQQDCNGAQNFQLCHLLCPQGFLFPFLFSQPWAHSPLSALPLPHSSQRWLAPMGAGDMDSLRHHLHPQEDRQAV